MDAQQGNEKTTGPVITASVNHCTKSGPEGSVRLTVFDDGWAILSTSDPTGAHASSMQLSAADARDFARKVLLALPDPAEVT